MWEMAEIQFKEFKWKFEKVIENSDAVRKKLFSENIINVSIPNPQMKKSMIVICPKYRE